MTVLLAAPVTVLGWALGQQGRIVIPPELAFTATPSQLVTTTTEIGLKL